MSRIRKHERRLLLALLSAARSGAKFAPDRPADLVQRELVTEDGWLDWGDHCDEGSGPFGARRAWRLTARGRRKRLDRRTVRG